jgi:hypothetical protein
VSKAYSWYVSGGTVQLADVNQVEQCLGLVCTMSNITCSQSVLGVLAHVL